MNSKITAMNKLTILIFCVVVVGCSQKPQNITQKIQQNRAVDVDSLTEVFLSGWNRQDSAAITRSIAENAIVMNDSLIHTGIHAIAQKWISGGVKVLSNIRTTSLIQGASESIAYNGGTYSVDLTIPGGPVLKERGNYSLVWCKQANREWKLTLIHIEDITRMPDIR